MAGAASEGKDGHTLQVHQERDLSFYRVCHRCIGQQVRESLPASMQAGSFEVLPGDTHTLGFS